MGPQMSALIIQMVIILTLATRLRHMHLSGLIQSAALVSNHMGDLVLNGYVFGFKSDDYLHSVATDATSLDDAVIILGSFDVSSCIRFKYLANTTLQKRNSGMWMSYTNWADNVGYISDLENWRENYKLANDLNYSSVLGAVNQVQDCTSAGCYSMGNKYWVGIGFSSQEGQNDAEACEAYVGVYGGLENECLSA